LWSAVARARVLARAPLARRRRRYTAHTFGESSIAAALGFGAPTHTLARNPAASKHHFGWVAAFGAGGLGRVECPDGRPLEPRPATPQTWPAVVARVLVALLVVAIPLAAPMLTYMALAMIR
jgi:hypothetical protein